MDEQQENVNRTGKWMFVLAWIVALGLLTMLFTDVLENRFNPNQNVDTKITDGTREVVLKSSTHGHYVASGKINGAPVVFIVDTGASYVSIPEKIANKLKLKKGVRYRTSTAAGQVSVYATELTEVSIGDISLQNVAASINPHNPDDEVLLGMSFLRRLEVSHKDGELTIRQ